MYNRYIPQPDGSFRRSRVEDPQQRPTPQPQRKEPPQQEPYAPPEPPKQEIHEHREEPRHRHSTADFHRGESITGFLKQLLPKDFDTGDLIVVLLLLLMAGDCEEDRGTALLTLALYMFM